MRTLQMMQDNRLIGHLLALVCAFVWGITFVSTKVLLEAMTPVEILLTRFVIGYALLWIVWPKRMRKPSGREEWLFAAAGLTGICLYYLLENIALVYTRASNVGVVVCLSPFFTVLLERLFIGRGRIGGGFFAGLALSLAGVALISWPAGSAVQFNPKGDLLAAAAALVWAFYCLFVNKIAAAGFEVLPATRRIFLYGIVMMLPFAAALDASWNPAGWMMPVCVGNLLFLGALASGLCFVFWSRSVAVLGAVRSTVYIYLVPVVTVVMAAVILDEPLGVPVLSGVALVIAGLVISQKSAGRR